MGYDLFDDEDDDNLRAKRTPHRVALYPVQVNCHSGRCGVGGSIDMMIEQQKKQSVGWTKMVEWKKVESEKVESEKVESEKVEWEMVYLQKNKQKNMIKVI